MNTKHADVIIKQMERLVRRYGIRQPATQTDEALARLQAERPDPHWPCYEDRVVNMIRQARIDRDFWQAQRDYQRSWAGFMAVRKARGY
jgi:hypothetical protein